jgi:hypothetical protein
LFIFSSGAGVEKPIGLHLFIQIVGGGRPTGNEERTLERIFQSRITAENFAHRVKFDIKNLESSSASVIKRRI